MQVYQWEREVDRKKGAARKERRNLKVRAEPVRRAARPTERHFHRFEKSLQGWDRGRLFAFFSPFSPSLILAKIKFASSVRNLDSSAVGMSRVCRLSLYFRDSREWFTVSECTAAASCFHGREDFFFQGRTRVQRARWMWCFFHTFSYGTRIKDDRFVTSSGVNAMMPFVCLFVRTARWHWFSSLPRRVLNV